MEYTKAKWLISEDGMTIETAHVPAGHVIASMNNIGDKVRADANLIAAAPKMYEALKAALPALQGILDKYDNRPKHIKDRINMIVEALASAEGNR